MKLNDIHNMHETDEAVGKHKKRRVLIIAHLFPDDQEKMLIPEVSHIHGKGIRVKECFSSFINFRPFRVDG